MFRIPYINIHAHHASSHADELTVVSIHASDLPPSSSSADLPFFSTGVHPWRAETDSLADDLSRMESAAWSSKCVALGEMGLDRLKGPGLDIQARIFEAQLELASRLGLPVIIHCVRAVDELLCIRKRYAAMGWIAHGFRGKPSTAMRLADNGIGVSFGVHILNPKELNTRSSLRQIPDDMLFLETDESVSPVREVYEAAAEIKGCSVEDLRQTVQANAERLRLF